MSESIVTAAGAGRSSAAARTAREPVGSAVVEVRRHLQGLRAAVDGADRHAPTLGRWGRELYERLSRGQRVLVAGNGGSAAEAQHLTAELVGRYRDERPAFSAIALNAESSSVTAIGNDYGFDEVFARQVRAHARRGDVVLLLSTSGRSENLLRAAQAAAQAGAASWALTGPGPNPLAAACDEAVCIEGESPHVQECHLAAVHALCRVFDTHALAAQRGRMASPARSSATAPEQAALRRGAAAPAGARAR